MVEKDISVYHCVYILPALPTTEIQVELHSPPNHYFHTNRLQFIPPITITNLSIVPLETFLPATVKRSYERSGVNLSWGGLHSVNIFHIGLFTIYGV